MERRPQVDVEALRRIVGARHVLDSVEETLVYECDGTTHFRNRPSLVVLPGSTEETRAVVEVLAAAAVPFVARGAGTGLSGGALPPKGGVVVETARMTRVLELDAENRVVRVECGITNAAVSRAARPHGLHYAPDPSSQVACTIGGNVAENAGGPHCFLHGATARHVLGLTAVLPDGTLLETGGPLGALDPASLRDAAGEGLDLTGILVGSEGTCAIVTEAWLRLMPLPEAVETLLAAFEDVETACLAVQQLLAAGLEPAAIEILDRLTIEAVEASVYAAGYPRGAGAVLLVEFEGAEEAVARGAAAAAERCASLSALSIERARDEAQRLRCWKGRKGAFGAMGRLAPDLYVQDAVVPRSALPEVLARVVAIGAKHRLRLSNVFHAGDGNLHPNVSYDRRDPDELRRVLAAGREILATCIEAGGSLSGEHGIGIEKREFMPLVFGEDDLAKMRAVRAAFNPDERLNPHKVLPLGKSCAEAKARGLAFEPDDEPVDEHASEASRSGAEGPA